MPRFDVVFLLGYSPPNLILLKVFHCGHENAFELSWYLCVRLFMKGRMKENFQKMFLVFTSSLKMHNMQKELAVFRHHGKQ